MKYLLIMIMAVMMSVSCSDDDDDDVNPLVGTWAISESIEGVEISLSATFKSDFTGTMASSIAFDGNTETESSSFTWSTSGNKLTMEIDGETETATFLILGNKLTITDEEGLITILTKQ